MVRRRTQAKPVSKHFVEKKTIFSNKKQYVCFWKRKHNFHYFQILGEKYLRRLNRCMPVCFRETGLTKKGIHTTFRFRSKGYYPNLFPLCVCICAISFFFLTRRHDLPGKPKPKPRRRRRYGCPKCGARSPWEGSGGGGGAPNSFGAAGGGGSVRGVRSGRVRDPMDA